MIYKRKTVLDSLSFPTIGDPRHQLKFRSITSNLLCSPRSWLTGLNFSTEIFKLKLEHSRGRNMVVKSVVFTVNQLYYENGSSYWNNNFTFMFSVETPSK